MALLLEESLWHFPEHERASSRRLPLTSRKALRAYICESERVPCSSRDIFCFHRLNGSMAVVVILLNPI